ncbi:DNA-3-methyladenine glycosylase [Afipia felis]|uniref:DNA-3-methyladenine glycosylase n=1 Tax=Afipia felis TaxID=1035 RepID=A0A090N6H3_AFIFE|nr:DNA-3-methyladenine glycosylase [Afipia felis]
MTALHGIGPWTADIYLLFCLGHGDAWPGGDLAVQEAMRIGLNLDARPTPKQATALAERWRPWRGAAAHLWWAYYHAVKRREGILPDNTARTESKAVRSVRAGAPPVQARVKPTGKPHATQRGQRKK